MHDKHENTGVHEANPWPDRINEAYYDKMGADFGRQTRDRINWMCSQARGETVLDVGCSQGIAAVLLAREGFHVLGLDISESAIEYANLERASEIETVRGRLAFRCGDLASLEGACYDTVLMGEVVEHQTNPVRFIRNAVAHVAPGGRIVITAPFGLHPWPDHKSALFPRHFVEALGESFALVLLDVTDGYLRIVADRSAGSMSVEANARTLLDVTEHGAVEAQEKYYTASAEAQREAKAKVALANQIATLHSQNAAVVARLDELASDMARRIAQATSDALREIATSQDRLDHYESLLREISVQKTLSEQSSRTIIELERECQYGKARIAELEEELQKALEKLQGAEPTSTHVAALQAARDEAECALQRSLRLERELEECRSDLATGRAQLADANRSMIALQAKYDREHNELLLAQHKRGGHWATYVAEQEYAGRLESLATELHQELELHRNSLALALGQALFGLTSVRGIVRFPGVMKRIVGRYLRRGDGAVQTRELQLPERTPVVIPPLKTVVGSPARRAMAATGDARGALNGLSSLGWEQEINPALPTVMSVLDEFSRACFVGQANLIEPRPDNWESLLEKYRPAFLLVESSWRGNQGAWQYRVASYANPPGLELSEMVDGCRARNIPTVFWNKEDPVHFTNFIDNASKFDLVLTTAAEARPRYSEMTKARVGVLQFAAEQSLHNPIGSVRRNNRVCFAGSYYANRFVERREDQLMLLDAASRFDLDIFDRNHNPEANAPSDFAFPERFAPHIRGRLSYEDVSRAYREYSVFLNVNSVIESPTMFSRRVFELLACGTPIVSTWSKGTEETFGNDLVWHVRTREEAEEAINVLLTDEREWRRRSIEGIRAVHGHHTYRHRFAQILDALGLPSAQSPIGDVLVVAPVGNQVEADAVTTSFSRQVLAPGITAKLVLVLGAGANVDARSDADLLATHGGSLVEALDRRYPRGSRNFTLMSPRALYGSHHVSDLALAAIYSQAAVVGKALRAKDQYQFDVELDAKAMFVREELLVGASMDLDAMLHGDATRLSKDIGKVYAADSTGFMALPGDVTCTDELLREIEL